MSAPEDRDRLSHRIAALSPEQRSALRKKLQTRARPPSLSSGQHGIWLAEQLRPSLAFNLLLGLHLKGPLDVAALERSLRMIVERHEVLRTTFRREDGVPVPVVHPPGDVSVPLTDLAQQAAGLRERLCRELATEESRRPFDLEDGPLLRPRLIRLSGEHHVLLVAVHHIAFDGWSGALFQRELTECYAACVEGRAPALAPLALQYGDLAKGQRTWIESPAAERQLAYWKRQLGGVLPTLELPADRPRPAHPTHHGAGARVTLPPPLVAQLRELARSRGVTLFMILLAGLQVLLKRYARQDDVIIGSSILKRDHAQTLASIGFFINMLVLRTDLTGSPTFVELLERTRETAVDAYANSDFPHDRLIAALNPSRDPSRNTLFQVEFQLLPPLQPPQRAAGLHVELADMPSGVVWTDLDVTAWEDYDGLQIATQYSCDLYDAPTIRRMLGHYRILLEAVVADPHRSIEQLPLLTADERELLATWNATRREPGSAACCHRRIEDQATKTPDSTAVVQGKTRLTYAELDARANRLAAYLQERGVGPETLVGIFLEPGADMLVGLLGILKAGGAYLPLEPTYPRERLAFLLEDARAAMLLTRSTLAERLPAGQAQVVCLDAEQEAIDRSSAAKPPDAATPESLAYVIYTSGSTGRPKGVEVTHGALVNFLGSMSREPGLTEEDRLLAVTTLSFDIAALELFLPLTVGASVVLVDRDVAADGKRLLDSLRASGATVMQATPATWRLLLDAGWSGDEQLKVLCGGESLSYDLARRLLPCAASVWNMYGPTETTVWSTCQRLTDPAGPIPIGRPIDNTTAHVLDRALQPVPPGVPGELYIGGAGLARGYRGRPELTAERFVHNPFDAERGDRLYKTGDLVRRLEDGALQFLRRLDDQVKLRGFRIEPGEIESGLREHPAIVAAAAAVRRYGDGDQRLIGYFVADAGGSPPTGTDLRRFLQDRLPDYMVPRVFVELEALPLTTSGKLDRDALPEPEIYRSGGETHFTEPRTEMERTLAAVWKEVLGLDAVSLHDNFFDLGGHSLLVMQVVLQLERSTGLRIDPLNMALQTLGQVATVCEEQRRGAVRSPTLDGRLLRRVRGLWRGGE